MQQFDNDTSYAPEGTYYDQKNNYGEDNIPYGQDNTYGPDNTSYGPDNTYGQDTDSYGQGKTYEQDNTSYGQGATSGWGSTGGAGVAGDPLEATALTPNKNPSTFGWPSSVQEESNVGTGDPPNIPEQSSSFKLSDPSKPTSPLGGTWGGGNSGNASGGWFNGNSEYR